MLSEFARTLVTDFPIKGILDHLVHRIVDILPIDAAGVSLISPTSAPHHVAGSDESAIRYELLQTTLNEGPCVAAYDSDECISIPDLHEELRFPRFIRSAIDEGLGAVFTFPLRNDGRCLGALDLYRSTPGELDERDMTTAQTLADVATAYLLNAETRSGKSDFVATVSHELRTPMTSIAGYVEMLQAGDAGALSPSQQRIVDTIARNVTRLTALADDLLTVSSLEASGSNSVYAELDLCAVIRDAQAMLTPAIAASPGLAVTFEVPAEPVYVRGNTADLEAMVVNLVSNALKFTEAGGWVSCALRKSSPSAALIEVSDNGLGIPAREQRDLFTRFFRSTTAQHHAIQGTGLGLTIVDSIVRSHGGEIKVVSEHLQGSTFSVTIPLTEAMPAADLQAG
ncbi:hypothetical protein BH09ACT12_BH09ACT12_29540 [soil metagenome]